MPIIIDIQFRARFETNCFDLQPHMCTTSKGWFTKASHLKSLMFIGAVTPRSTERRSCEGVMYVIWYGMTLRAYIRPFRFHHPLIMHEQAKCTECCKRRRHLISCLHSLRIPCQSIRLCHPNGARLRCCGLMKSQGENTHVIRLSCYACVSTNVGSLHKPRHTTYEGSTNLFAKTIENFADQIP